MSDFVSLVRERRSASNFLENITIPQEEFEEIFKLVKFHPSAFNLQHAHYLVVTDPEKKEALYEVAYKQHKVHTSSAAIIVLGDKKAYKNAEQIYESLLKLGIMDEMRYESMIQSIYNTYEGKGEQFQLEEAIRNASLSAMLFMLIAKDRGWDTCPMIGFDPEGVKTLFNIPENLVPVLMITMGKENLDNRRPRGYRKPTREFVTFNGF
jgi:putative NAD(P)H nitroreductase